MVLKEASSLDRIKMTKFWLEYDQKIFTLTNVNVGTRSKVHINEHLCWNTTEKVLKMDVNHDFNLN